VRFRLRLLSPQKHGGTEMDAAGNGEVAAHRRDQDSLPFTQALPQRHRSERTQAAAGRQPEAAIFSLQRMSKGPRSWLGGLLVTRYNFTPDAVLGPLASAL
jgi:hypothetical protein